MAARFATARFDSLEDGPHPQANAPRSPPAVLGRPLLLDFRCIRGRVVRLEELPEPAKPAESEEADELAEDRYEVGVAFDLGWGEGIDDLLDFLEKARDRQIGRRP